MRNQKDADSCVCWRTAGESIGETNLLGSHASPLVETGWYSPAILLQEDLKVCSLRLEEITIGLIASSDNSIDSFIEANKPITLYADSSFLVLAT